MKGKVPDSSFFCCASPPKTDGQVFTAADVPHQGFGFQAALQRLGTTRNLSGKLHFSTRSCGDGDILDDAAVQGLERMLRVKARLETVSAGCCGVSGGPPRGCGGETVFETAHSTAGESTMDIALHEVHESERLDAQAQKSCGGFGAAETAAFATAGESVGILGLRQVIESDVARSSSIHESSLARSCADVGVSVAGVSVSGSAAPCVAALPCGRSLTYAQVAANACGEVASACNSGRLDMVYLLKVQQMSSCNPQGVVALNSRRKVRQSCTVGNRYAEQAVDMSPARDAGTYRRSAGTVHAQRQVPRKRLARSSGVRGAVQVLVPVVGLVWLGVPGPRCGLLGGFLLVGGATWAASTCTAIFGLGAGMWY